MQVSGVKQEIMLRTNEEIAERAWALLRKFDFVSSDKDLERTQVRCLVHASFREGCKSGSDSVKVWTKHVPKSVDLTLHWRNRDGVAGAAGDGCERAAGEAERRGRQRSKGIIILPIGERVSGPIFDF